MKSKITKKRIIHLIPSNTIGGVESAAKTSIGIKSNKFIFSIKILSKQKKTKNLFLKTKSFIDIFFSTFQVLNLKPDFLIVSLWKSCLSALIIKFLKPSTKIILFLHLPKSVNFIDFLLNFVTAKIAYQIWSDSLTTLEKRGEELRLDIKVKKRIISFLAYKLNPNVKNEKFINFIFWGRLAKEKRIDLSIKLFAKISENIKDSKFLIIGPDCGELTRLKKQRDDLNLRDRIIFIPPLDINSIKEISQECLFFLQLSKEEGLGMSIVESMQLGLIPLVTNVGEIKNYCINNQNSIIYNDLESTKKIILNLIKNKKQIETLKYNAVKKWTKAITYREDLKNAIESLFD